MAKRIVRHSWRRFPEGSEPGERACVKCGLRSKWNMKVPSRPYYSTDDGKTWDTTEYGYVPACVEREKAAE